MFSRSPFSVPLLSRSLGAFLVLLLVGACGGGGTYSVDEGRIAEGFLPSERTVDYHPDSLGALTITEDEGKLQFQLEQDFEALLRRWSCRFRNVGTGSTPQSRTYATFWSLELSLVALQPEMGILGLQKERARELIEEQRKGYYDTIQIDVYWFVGRAGNGIISGPGARTELIVQNEAYRPVRTDHGPLREAFVGGGGVALYRRNTLHFPRTVDGADILENASGMQLEVRRTGAGSKEQFSWQWEGDQPA